MEKSCEEDGCREGETELEDDTLKGEFGIEGGRGVVGDGYGGRKSALL